MQKNKRKGCGVIDEMLKKRERTRALKRYKKRNNLKIINLNQSQVKILQRLLEKHLESIDEAIAQMHNFTLPSNDFKIAKQKIRNLWESEKNNAKVVLEKLKESRDGKNKNRVYQSNRFR